MPRTRKAKGEIRFDTLGNDLSKVQNLEIWQGMLDQLNLKCWQEKPLHF